MYENLAILACFIFLYSLVSAGLERTPISGAIVYTSFGLVFGPFGLDLLTLKIDAEGVGILAELTLALVLFTDAANADISVLKKSVQIPRRLLLIGLPLTILLGFGVGVLMSMGLTMLEVAILATMLAPTDAALGKAVVSDKTVPANIRESLNVESGLNDGICVPILFLFLTLAAGISAEERVSALIIDLLTRQIGIGLAVGAGLTALCGFLLKSAKDRGWVTETWQQLPIVTLSVASFAVAQLLGGSGFIACFCGGLLFGRLVRKQYKEEYLLAAEGTGDTVALITWVIFGSAVVGKAANHFTWTVFFYAILSLTLIRMLPVFLSLAGMSLRTDEKLFMGWFGPRGLASIVFAVIVLHRNLPGGGTLAITVVLTVTLSIVLHGISAKPFVSTLASRRKRAKPSTPDSQR